MRRSTPWSLGMGDLQPLINRESLSWVFINPYGLGLMSYDEFIPKNMEIMGVDRPDRENEEKLSLVS